MSGSEPNPRDAAREPQDDLELDLDLDLDPRAGSAPESAPAPAAPRAAEDQASGGFDLDLDLPAAGPAPVPAPAEAAAGGGLDFQPSGLDITDDAPEGLYARPDEALAFEAPGGPVVIGDESYDAHAAGAEAEEALDEELEYADEDAFDADDLGIDFESPAPARSNRGIVIAAGIAGALAAGVMAIVDPGNPEPTAPGAAPTTAPVAALRPRTAPEPASEPVVAEPTSALAAAPVDRVGEGFDLLTAITTRLEDRAASFAGLAPGATGDAVDGPAPGDAPSATGGLIGRVLGGLLAGAAPENRTADAGAEETVATAETEPSAPADPLRESRTAQLDVLDQVLLPEDRSGIEFVRPEELADVWLGEEIPPDGVDGRSNRLTPRVGPVRLITRLGEVFQGELYAIGGGEVSISNHLGRMSFSARQVQRLERLPAADDPLPIATDAPGRRVRVRVPGGWIHGRVLAEDRGRVTLLTESGGRVTLPATEIVPLGAKDVLPYPSADQQGAREATGVAPAEEG